MNPKCGPKARPPSPVETKRFNIGRDEPSSNSKAKVSSSMSSGGISLEAAQGKCRQSIC